MAYKNPEDKKRWSKRWREQSKTNGYNDWLYARRKVRFDDAAAFRETLLSIENIGDRSSALIARTALEESRRRWEALGEPPHRKRKDVKLDGLEDPKTDSLFEAVAKLGLPN